ncbi:MAG: rhomboid family intramembrane serine protease, partial [Gammaproteobacteria bacterium]
MIPLHDDNPTRRFPYLTIAFISACVLVYFWQASLGPQAGQAVVYSLGVIPAVLLGKVDLPPEIVLIPPAMSVFTSMFMHGGFMHLAGNMLYLWIFGNNVEDMLGHGRFIVFYLLCGIAAV